MTYSYLSLGKNTLTTRYAYKSLKDKTYLNNTYICHNTFVIKNIFLLHV